MPSPDHEQYELVQVDRETGAEMDLADLSTHRGIEVGQVDDVSPGKGGH